VLPLRAFLIRHTKPDAKPSKPLLNQHSLQCEKPPSHLFPMFPRVEKTIISWQHGRIVSRCSGRSAYGFARQREKEAEERNHEFVLRRAVMICSKRLAEIARANCNITERAVTAG
jgi:hypothetical protein